MQHQIALTNARLAESEKQITQLQQELTLSQKAMLTDALTEIGNRRFFEMTVEAAVNQMNSESKGSGLVALFLIDLDLFKRVNDSFGHHAGDDVLVFVASELQRLAIEGSVARIGGDEFAIVQHVESGEHAEEFGDQIREFFSDQSLVLSRSQEELGKITLSIGAALLRRDDSRSSWYRRADQMLQASKVSGRNRLTIEPKIGR